MTAAAACGGETAGGTSGTDGGSTSRTCPSTPPTNGSGCTFGAPEFASVTGQCTWGNDPRPLCRTKGICQEDGTWLITPPADANFCSTPPLPPQCPSSPATMGTQCSELNLFCWYPDGTVCNCSECEGGSAYPFCSPISPPEWACQARPQGCPIEIPQAGTHCDEEDASCGADCTLQVFCQDGTWVWQMGVCPICASPNTMIATPDGERPIASLHVGDLVYSVDLDALVAVPILRTASTPVVHHEVMRVELRNGAVLEISSGHPTADGRHFGDLAAGNLLDAQNEIISTELVPYTYDRTFDILPDSSTGTYVAGGALIGSTLFESGHHCAEQTEL